MTDKPNFNFKSGLEQAGVVDSTSAMLQDLGKQAGKAMGLELAKGYAPGAMYLASTAQEIARSAQGISGFSNMAKRKLDSNNTNDAPAAKGPRVK